jgi:hypothetical protein
MAGLTTLVCPNCGYIAVLGAFDDLGVDSIDCARCGKPIDVREAIERIEDKKSD